MIEQQPGVYQMTVSIPHIGLTCSTEEKADRFYGGLLGLEKQASKSLDAALAMTIFQLPEEAVFSVCNYANGSIRFEIFVNSRFSVDPGRVNHICIEVDSLPDFLQKCEDLGVSCRQIPKGEKVLTFIRDFDGNLFEVVEKPA